MAIGIKTERTEQLSFSVDNQPKFAVLPLSKDNSCAQQSLHFTAVIQDTIEEYQTIWSRMTDWSIKQTQNINPS